jgi:hypothetical protein
MVAVMALMEAPAIIVGVILIRMFDKKQESKRLWVIHSFQRKCTFDLGSLIIGMLASDEQALGIKPLRMIYSRDFSPYSF